MGNIINDNINAAMNIIANGGWRGLQNGSGLNPAARRIRDGDYVRMYNELMQQEQLEKAQRQIEKENRIRAAEDIRQKILMNDKLQWELDQKKAAAKKAEEEANLQMQLSPYMPTRTFDSETGNIRSEGYIPSEPMTEAVRSAAGPGYLGDLMATAINSGNELANLQKQQPEEFKKYMAAVQPYKGTTVYSESGSTVIPADDKPEKLDGMTPEDIVFFSGARPEPYYNIEYKPDYIAEKEYTNNLAKDLFMSKENTKQDNKMAYAAAQNGYKLTQQNNDAANKQQTERVKGEIKLNLENKKAANRFIVNAMLKKYENSLTIKRDDSGKPVKNANGQGIIDKENQQIIGMWKENLYSKLDKESSSGRVLTLEDQYRIGKEAAKEVLESFNGLKDAVKANKAEEILDNASKGLNEIKTSGKGEYNQMLNNLLKSQQSSTPVAKIGKDTANAISNEDSLYAEYGK